MTVTSDTEPQTVEIDITEPGRARALIHWDIRQIERTDETGERRTAYEYEERAIWVTGSDPVKALETRNATLVDAVSKNSFGSPIVRDTATGLPGRVQPTKDDPTIEADEIVRTRTESGYRTLPMPRRTPVLPAPLSRPRTTAPSLGRCRTRT